MTTVAEPEREVLFAELAFVPGALPLTMICRCRLTDSSLYVQDEEGFVICPEHGYRRLGWRSLPEIEKGRGDYAYAKFTPLQVERIVLFGEKPEYGRPEVKSSVEDRRDNRDPEAIGASMLAQGSRPSSYPAQRA